MAVGRETRPDGKTPAKVNTKRGGGIGAKVVSAAVGMVMSYAANPENLDRLVIWVRDQHFPQKISDSLERLRQLRLTSGKQDPLTLIVAECNTVEDLIETRSAELADDAPIVQWRDELDKIRRGVEFMEKSPVKERRKIRDLQRRSKKLFDSAFAAAVK
ncbi:hypothetical protein COO72_06260 [Bifidobacterium callitrichos]|nr:hypothetical protein COO72_06260 [Bifidobacterium callitrichos]